MKLHNDLETLLHADAIRKLRLGDSWLYSATDLLAALSDHPDPAEHWEDLKRWEPSLASLTRQVQVRADDGSYHPVEMLDTEQALRVLQSLHSPAAERIKLWLAEAGRMRLEEAADPELAIRRTRQIYEQRGYSRPWIEKRLRSISARHELTGQWFRRGVQESDQYRALTNELMASAFGMDVQAYKDYKGLRTESLRDHMNDLELALTQLSETTAAFLHQDRDSTGLDQLRRDVQDAGQIAGQTRLEIERRLGKPVVSPDNQARPGTRKKQRLTPAAAEK